MERGNSKHGARLDDQLEKETRGLVQADREVRGEEWKSAEPSGEDQPEVDRAPDTTLTGGVPAGLTEEDVEGRARLAAVLGKSIWPADTGTIRQRARDEHATDDILALVDRLPDGAVYANVAEAWEQLTGHKERHRF
ncbi:MAG: hypothetical protein JWN55_1021 [Frankiales bacterium]|nr:hypothetical protein [Frankiales bacterium]